MGNVTDILNQKQRHSLQSTHPHETVLSATQKMNQHSIGALLVIDDDGNLVGIFTERDVLRRVVAAEKAPSRVRVGEVMTAEVACCRPETSIDDARSIFRQHRIRHLPVVDEGGTVQGLISIGDLNAHHSNHQEVTIHFLHEYMHGRT
ncbi:MAG: CBS domain-containing protein [Fuerstia sp.]|nr:CBS domain-containing protein [Fuerstiella sp.]